MSRIDDAYAFYIRHIHDTEKVELLKKNNLKIAGSVPSVIWELFGSILTGRSGAGTIGADLIGWEVKSAKTGGSYEYQYHLNTGAAKLDEDCNVNHMFCAYSETYEDVIVRIIRGRDLSERFFTAWKPEYARNYNAAAPASERRQRFRKNIPFSYVESHGHIILSIEAGKIISRDDNLLFQYNNE